MKPKFLKSSKHLPELKKHVNFSEKRDQWWVLLLPLAYFAVYLIGLLSDSIIGYLASSVIMALLLCPIYIYILHEAVHGHVFLSARRNARILRVFDLIGGNSYIFKRRHMLSHHSFCNIAGWDTDIEQSGPIKIAQHAKHEKYHSYQHIYAFFLYPIYVMNWIVVRDFKDIFRPNLEVRQLKIDVPFREYIILILSKAWILTYLVILPGILYGWGVAVGVFVLFTVVASLTALLALLPPHVTEDCEFPVLENGNINSSWFDHQISTTAHVEFSSKILEWYYGFFNHHLTHHLMPNFPWYALKKSTADIESFLNQKKVPYQKLRLADAFIKHYKLLKRNGRAIDLLDETM